MQDNPYYQILQSNKPKVSQELDEKFGTAYMLLIHTILCLAIIVVPTFVFIANCWFTASTNMIFAFSAAASVTVGCMLRCVLLKNEKFTGAWKRPTIVLKHNYQLKFAGLCYFRASEGRLSQNRI
jgi:hypothetical protein